MVIRDVFDDPRSVAPITTPDRPSLLISLRSIEEVQIAVGYPIDIIDLKEPRRGPLAPASRELWIESVQIVEERCRWDDAAAKGPTGNRTPKLSAALGESAEARVVAADLPPQFDFAKVGPSGCDSIPVLARLWSDVRDRIPRSTELVAVAYADFKLANSLSPETVFETAKREGLRCCLIDTFTKDGRSTLDHLPMDRLHSLAELAGELEIWWTLAGSIRLDDVERLAKVAIHPDCIGVRGDVCSDDRTSPLCRTRLRQWSSVFTA